MTHNFGDDADNINRALHSSMLRSASRFDFGRTDHKMITRLLKSLLARLIRFYSIEKASLAFYDHGKDNLRVTHMFSKQALKSSLTLTIPSHNSLLHQVLMQGYPVVDNYPELITGSIIEKKILLAGTTRSMLIIPLIHDGIRLGVLSLASRDESAFGLYLEGIGVEILDEFVTQINEIMDTANTV